MSSFEQVVDTNSSTNCELYCPRKRVNGRKLVSYLNTSRICFTITFSWTNTL